MGGTNGEGFRGATSGSVPVLTPSELGWQSDGMPSLRLALHGGLPPAGPLLAGAMTVFKRFVEIGRVVLISYGPDAGKLATIVDVIDANRVLLDGPEKLTGVHRHEINIKRITLTDYKVAAKHNATHKCVASPGACEPTETVQGRGGGQS